MKNLLNLIIDAAKNDDMNRVIELAKKQQDNFCDSNCVWTDHHPDCVRAAPVGFVVDRYNGANTPSLPPTAMVAWLNDNPKIGQVLYAHPPVPTAQPKEPEQEPVARSAAYDMIDRFLQNNLNSDADYAEYSKALDSLYTTPPQRKPLTDKEIADIVVEMNGNEPTALFWRDLARAIESSHGIGENK